MPDNQSSKGNDELTTTTRTPSIQQRIADLPRDCITCDACRQPDPRKRCSACQTVYYCSRDCQKNHWLAHKADCKLGKRLLTETLGLEGDVLSLNNNRNDDNDSNNKTKALNDECPICLSSGLENPVMLQGCRHQYCFSCIQAWQQRWSVGKKASVCPYCKTESSSSVQEVAMERARLLASRAKQLESSVIVNEGDEAVNKESIQTQIRQLQEEAIDELDKILNSGSKYPHIQAFITKAEIYMQNVDTCEAALELFDQVIQLSEDRSQKMKQLSTMLERVDRAAEMGLRDQEAEEVLEQAQKDIEQYGFPTVFAGRNDLEGILRYTDIHLSKAETLEKMGEWNQAKEIFMNFLDRNDFFRNTTPPQQRKVFMGLSRCAYHLGVHDKAIAAAQPALEMNRHFPGVHKYLALAYKAQGDLDKAVEVTNQAALYETPWDDNNRKEVLKLYDELKAELDASSST